MGVKESITYSDSASTVSSTIPAFAKRGDLLIVDEGCSDAVMTGVFLSRCKALFFAHNDAEDLERVLDSVAKEDARSGSSASQQRRFVVVESVYRNYGDKAPLEEIVRLKKKHACRLVLDESVGFGVLGPNGRGLYEEIGIPIEDVDILCAALSCSLGSVGGFCIGNEPEVVDHQRLAGAGYCYSASAPPFVAEAARLALEKMQTNEGRARMERVANNARALHEGIEESVPGLRLISSSGSPTLHLRAANVSDDEEDEGVLAAERASLQRIALAMRAEEYAVLVCEKKFVPPPMYKPGAPRGSCPVLPPPSLRVTTSSDHDDDAVKRIIDALAVASAAEFVGNAKSSRGTRRKSARLRKRK